MRDIANIEKFRFWAHKIIPLVYDDSLSYYEFLCKVVAKLNEVIDGFAQQNEALEEFSQEMDDRFESLKAELLAFIRAEFATLREEILNELSEIIGNIVTNYSSDISYDPGYYVLKDGKIYVALDETTIGEFVPAEWSEVVLSDNISSRLANITANMTRLENWLSELDDRVEYYYAKLSSTKSEAFFSGLKALSDLKMVTLTQGHESITSNTFNIPQLASTGVIIGGVASKDHIEQIIDRIELVQFVQGSGFVSVEDFTMIKNSSGVMFRGSAVPTGEYRLRIYYDDELVEQGVERRAALNLFVSDTWSATYGNRGQPDDDMYGTLPLSSIGKLADDNYRDIATLKNRQDSTDRAIGGVVTNLGIIGDDITVINQWLSWTVKPYSTNAAYNVGDYAYVTPENSGGINVKGYYTCTQQIAAPAGTFDVTKWRHVDYLSDELLAISDRVMVVELDVGNLKEQVNGYTFSDPMTQAEYDAMASHDVNTIYIVV